MHTLNPEKILPAVITCSLQANVLLLYLWRRNSAVLYVIANHDSLCSDRAATTGFGLVCRYATHVHEALTGLVADVDQEVRRLMAVQFHDICKMLGKERCAQYMKR